MPGLIAAALATNTAFAIVALVLGESLLRLCSAVVGGVTQPPSLQRFATAVLAGLGGCSLAGIPLAAMHLFRWQAFTVCGALALALGRRIVVAYMRAGTRLLQRARHAEPFVLVLVAVGVVVAVAGWLAALAPPVVDDELKAHLPEARLLANTHVLHLALSDDLVYGNLPKLLETLYGEALTIDGVPLMHALHVTLVVAFVVLAASVTKSLWGTRAAALAVAGIALYADLLANATVGQVDAGEAAFEAGAMLLLALWLVRRDPAVAASAFLLLGFALATKYTAGPAAVFATLVLGTIGVRARRWRELAGLAGIVLVASGYWYGKNFVRFGNPVFPFLFGHPGLTEAQYRQAVSAVNYFVSGPRDISTFLAVPGRFATFPNAVAAMSFVLSPLALVARGPWKAAALLLAYAAAYTTYWFWFASHQDRFLISAILVTIVLLGAAVGAARGRVGVTATLVIAVVFVVGARVHLQKFHGSVQAAFSTWLSSNGAEYTLGLESQAGYLRHYFGCQVDAVFALKRLGLRGGVGIYELEPPPEFSPENPLVPLQLSASTPAGVRAELRRLGVRYLQTPGRSTLGLSSDPAARPVLAAAKPFWHGGGCWLFRLDLGA